MGDTGPAQPQAVGSHGAAALRPALLRAAKQGHAAVRKAALSGAAQQKLILCSSILQEASCREGPHCVNIVQHISLSFAGGPHIWIQTENLEHLRRG